MNTELIVYLLRKTSLTRTEIGKLSPLQFEEVLKETYFQESVEEYRYQHSIASLLAAIYNTIPRKRGSKILKAEDFLKGEMPSRNKKTDNLETLAVEKGIKLPSKEIKNRGS